MNKRTAIQHMHAAEERILWARHEVCDYLVSGLHSPECAELAAVQIALTSVLVRFDEERTTRKQTRADLRSGRGA